MKMHRIVGLSLSCALFAGAVFAAEALKSGPQVNEEVPGPFHPVNVTGAKAGERHCLYCQNGNNPVAMIFAREASPEVTKLIKTVDACTAKHGDCKMGSFVVFLSDAENLAKDLKSLAEKEGIKQCVLSIDNPAGPEKYKVAKEAEVTVVLYVDHKVQANHTFRSGELNEKAIGNIVSDVKKILPK